MQFTCGVMCWCRWEEQGGQRHPPTVSGVPLRILHSSALPVLTASPCGPKGELQPVRSSFTNWSWVTSEQRHFSTSRNKAICTGRRKKKYHERWCGDSLVLSVREISLASQKNEESDKKPGDLCQDIYWQYWIQETEGMLVIQKCCKDSVYLLLGKCFYQRPGESIHHLLTAT